MFLFFSIFIRLSPTKGKFLKCNKLITLRRVYNVCLISSYRAHIVQTGSECDNHALSIRASAQIGWQLARFRS